MGRTKDLLEDMFYNPRRSLRELLDEVEMLRQEDLKIAEEVDARQKELEEQENQEEEQ
jgi:hypothetical protein